VLPVLSEALHWKWKEGDEFTWMYPSSRGEDGKGPEWERGWYDGDV
jgi:hypothetical protein